MNAAATSRQNQNTSKHPARSRRLGGRFTLAGAILVGSMAIAGTAGAANPGPGDTDPPPRRPGDVPTYMVEPIVPDYEQRSPQDYRDHAKDHRDDLDPDVLVEGQFHDGDTVDSCDDDCVDQDNGRRPNQLPDPDDRIAEDDGAWIDEPMDQDNGDEPGDENYDEDYGDKYPHGCGEDELVACPDDYPLQELECGDYDEGVCDNDYPEYGTTTTTTTSATPLEVVDVEVKGKQTGGDSLAYTGSNSKLPLIGAGLLAAGGVAAGLSILSRRNKADQA